MIVVRLMGGLGNQLFQFAAARALALKHGVPLRFDTAYLGIPTEGTVREYELHHFCTSGRALNARERYLLGASIDGSLPQRAIGRLYRSAAGYVSYQEPDLVYDESVAQLPDHAILSGRFQSWRYLKGAEDTIRAEISLRQPTSPRCSALIDCVRGKRALGIHVRRTDYVDHPVYAQTIGALPLSYYERALAQARTLAGADLFRVVVSDDIEWCMAQDVFEGCDLFVDLREEANASIEEFEILRNCSSFVISNSTFAWWAAWLSQTDANGGFVIAPAEWSRNSDVQTRTRVPPAWLTV